MVVVVQIISIAEHEPTADIGKFETEKLDSGFNHRRWLWPHGERGRHDELCSRHPESRGIVTLNSWNEWVEASYIEPDTVNGMKYLARSFHTGERVEFWAECAEVLIG